TVGEQKSKVVTGLLVTADRFTHALRLPRSQALCFACTRRLILNHTGKSSFNVWLILLSCSKVRVECLLMRHCDALRRRVARVGNPSHRVGCPQLTAPGERVLSESGFRARSQAARRSRARVP